MTDNRFILQIVPQPPGDHGGVSDYARQLAGSLRDYHEIISTFISATPASSSQSADGFAVVSPLRRVSSEVGSPVAILLHYVNYGYDPRGIPFWLPAVLRRMQTVTGKRLVTIFHELYAEGSWTQSAFWLRPVQQYLVRKIALLSATGIVTNDTHRAQLQRLIPEARILTQPVASNFGEPDLSLTQSQERDPHRWIICGGTDLIERSLESFLENIRHIPENYRPRELVVMGGSDRSEIRNRLTQLRSVQTHYYPNIERDAAGQILSESTFGWIDYFHNANVPMATILKSTVFAAFCANGVIPVFPHGGSAIHLNEQTLCGPFFVNESAQSLPAASERVAVAQSLHEWYQKNASTKQIAQKIADIVSSPNLDSHA
ncbi:MAG: hypothetical protein ACR2G0_00250 [Chthoniobacterales bacterium]